MRSTIYPFLLTGILQCTAQTLLVESTFDTDADGWTGVFGTVRYDTNGFVWVRPPADGDSTFYNAPAKFLGNKSGAYGGSLQFSMRDNRTGNYGNTTVLLQGAGFLLRRNTSYPTNGWQDYDVPLSTNLWRTAPDLASPAPTEAQMLAVLSDLTGLLIRGEFNNSASNETNSLDNVRIVALTCVSNSILRVYPEPTAVRLEWPTNACNYWPCFATNITDTHWTYIGPGDDIVPLFESNGLYHLTITPSRPQRFYRLRREPLVLP